MKRLSEATFPVGERPPVGILHLGLGAFHRAHQAVYTEDVGGWGICGVTQRSTEVLEQLRPQDCLFSVVERGHGAVRHRVVGSVREVLFAGTDTERLGDRFADPDVRIVSLTVTEKGYRRDPRGRLDLTDPLVQQDIAGAAPRTVVGQLVRGLQRRRSSSEAPVTVLSCDNLLANGATTHTLALDFCAALPSSEGEPLAEWIGQNVRFPNTVVDRIVPATTPEDRAAAAALLGLADAATVVAEPYRQWVIEDDFAAGRPAWEWAGAVFTADVGPYETVKLRLLNATHSLLAYLGALAGHDTIAAAIADPAIREAAEGLMREDALPTLTVPPGLNPRTLAAEILDRLANPALRHRTSQVAMDGSQKLPPRLLDTIRDRFAKNATAHWAIRAVAAWMVYVATADALSDPIAPTLQAAAAGHRTARPLVTALLSVHSIFGDDLPANAAFREALIDTVGELLTPVER